MLFMFYTDTSHIQLVLMNYIYIARVVSVIDILVISGLTSSSETTNSEASRQMNEERKLLREMSMRKHNCQIFSDTKLHHQYR